ncbi:hypothetical protein ACWD5R_10735 [Streptomyces sp. NPDC002514]|uniref:hypothetical protein n=1 Tax=unclassified Streptomyces TaxID=2593676 RepID=UPI0036CD32BD
MRKRRWPRSCSGCGSEPDRASVVAEATDVAVAYGLLGWIGRGVMGVVRLVLRILG